VKECVLEANLALGGITPQCVCVRVFVCFATCACVCVCVFLECIECVLKV